MWSIFTKLNRIRGFRGVEGSRLFIKGLGSCVDSTNSRTNLIAINHTTLIHTKQTNNHPSTPPPTTINHEIFLHHHLAASACCTAAVGKCVLGLPKAIRLHHRSSAELHSTISVREGTLPRESCLSLKKQHCPVCK